MKTKMRAGRRRLPRWVVLMILALAFVGGACSGSSPTSTSATPGSSTTAGSPITTSGSSTTAPGSSTTVAAGTGTGSGATASPATAVAETLGPSVVDIGVYDASGNQLGLGSGVIFSADGVLVTNNHVVTAETDTPAAKFQVTLANGQEYPGTLVGRDALSDLAVLRIQATGLPAAQFLSDLSSLKVGDYAIAIGTPLGLENTVTMGIVSAIRREIDVSGGGAATDYIQTDAAISPGNSGGALADAQGRVIGINAAGLSAQSGAQNIGFAIPSDVVIYVVDQILANGRVRYSFLGVQSSGITPALRQQFNLAQSEGVVVLTVAAGSPAAAAGVKQGDIIVSIDGRTVAGPADLFKALREIAPGTQVDLKIVRGGQQQTLKITLGERQGQ